MADDLAISVQIGADLDDLEQKLAAAGKMVADFATSLSKTAASGSASAGRSHGQAADASTRAWNSTAKSIESSMNSTIGSVLRGTTSFKAGLDKVAVGIEQKFLDIALRIPEEWASAQLRMLVQSILGEKERAGVAQSGMLTRSGIEASETAYLSASKTTEGVVHGAVEIGKTEATATGAATRGSIEAAASSESIGMSIATGLADIAVKAAQAAAGAYAAIASIPYVGPVLAPVAAAGALAAVFAIGKGIASAEGGWGQVPYDGALTELHKDEMVLPASIASPLRQSLASPPSGAAGQGGGTMHFHFAPTVSAVDATGVDRLLQQHQDVFVRNVKNWHRNGKLGPKGALA